MAHDVGVGRDVYAGSGFLESESGSCGQEQGRDPGSVAWSWAHCGVQRIFGTVRPKGLLTLPVETSLWVWEAGVSKKGVAGWSPVVFFWGCQGMWVGRGAACPGGCSVLSVSGQDCAGSTHSMRVSSGLSLALHFQPAL